MDVFKADSQCCKYFRNFSKITALMEINPINTESEAKALRYQLNMNADVQLCDAYRRRVF